MPWIESHYTGYIVHSRGGSTLVQVDYEFPALAESMGWSLRRVQKNKYGETVHLMRSPRRGSGCDHPHTDGSVDCDVCGVKAGEFISAANEFLSSIAL